MFKKVILAAVLAAAAASSFAGTPGFYAGLDLGSTKVDGLSGSQTSAGGFAGYSFNQTFAVEGAYRRLGQWDIDGYGVSAHQAAISVIGYMPLGPFNFFGRLGVNNVDAVAKGNGTESSASANGVLVGGGVAYNFSNQLSARLEVQRPASDMNNVDVAIVYSF